MEQSDEMRIILETLLDENRMMTESAILNSTGLDWDQLDTALQRLMVRGLIRCDSFEPSKRGGQDGVRRWGVSHKTPLWEAVRDDKLEGE